MSAIITNPNPKQPTKIEVGVGKFDESNLFDQDLKKPEFDLILKELSVQYTIADVLEKINEGGTCKNDTIYWTELGYWKKTQTITSQSITTVTAAVTITEAERFFIVTDLISLPSGKQAVVKSIDTLSPQVVTIEATDGQNFVTGDFTAADGTKNLYLMGSMMPKCGDLPAGRYYTPKSQNAITTIVATTADYCVDDTSQITWVGADGYWYHKNQVLKRQEHRITKQDNILWNNGNTTATSSGATSGAGLVPIIFAGGTVVSDSTNVTENDVIDYISLLSYNGANYKYKEYMCICGYKYMTAVTKALKDYVVHSNADSRYVKGGEGVFGLELAQYKLNGTVVSFWHCAAFDEPATPNVAGITDTQNMGLYLNIGENSNGRGIELVYRQLMNGIVENELMAKSNGMGSVANGGVIQTKNRCFSEYISSNFILKVTYRNSHGIHMLVS